MEWLLKKVMDLLIGEFKSFLRPFITRWFKSIIRKRSPLRELRQDNLDELRNRLDGMRSRISEDLASLNDRDRKNCCKRLCRFWVIVIDVLTLLEKRYSSYDPLLDRVLAEKSSYEAALRRIENNSLGAADVDIFVRVVITLRTLCQNESTRHYFDLTDLDRIENSASAACSALIISSYLFAYVRLNMEQFYAYMDPGDKDLVSNIRKVEAYPGYWEESEERVLRAAEIEIKTLRCDRQNLHMLDLGCGVGRLTNRFASNFVSIVALDPDRERLSEAQQSISANHPKIPVEYRCEPFEADMFEERRFDVIICSHVIQHLQTGLLADFLSEITRILRPDGLLFLLTSCSRLKHDEFVVDGLDTYAFLLPRRYERDIKATRVTVKLVEFLNGLGISLAPHSCTIYEPHQGCWILKDGKNNQVVFISIGSRLVAQFEGHEGLQFSVKSRYLGFDTPTGSDLDLDAIKQVFDCQKMPLLQPRVSASDQLENNDAQKKIRFWLVNDANNLTKYLLIEQNERVKVFAVLFSENEFLGTALASQDFSGLRRVFSKYNKLLPTKMSLITIIPGQYWEIGPSRGGDLGKNYLVVRIANSYYVSYGVRWSFISRERFDSLLPVNKFLILPTRRFAMISLEDQLCVDYEVLWLKWFHFNRRFGLLDRLLNIRRDLLFNRLPLKKFAWFRAKLDVGDVGVLCKRRDTKKKRT